MPRAGWEADKSGRVVRSVGSFGNGIEVEELMAWLSECQGDRIPEF